MITQCLYFQASSIKKGADTQNVPLGSTPSRPVSSTRHQIIKKMLIQKVLKTVLVSRCQPKGHGSRPGLVQSQVAKNLGLGVRVATRFAQSRSQIILGGQLLMPFATMRPWPGSTREAQILNFRKVATRFAQSRSQIFPRP